jgi:hypothetical protein
MAQPATVWESAGYWNSWYTDPAHINVAGEHDFVHWRWNGGCVTEAVPGGTSGQPGSNSTSQNWYWQTTWGENSTHSTFGQSCFSAYSQQNTLLENQFFCSAISGGSEGPTWVHFGNSYVSGRYNGGLVGQDGYSPQLTGGCTNLLVYNSQLKFTENGVFIHN